MRRKKGRRVRLSTQPVPGSFKRLIPSSQGGQSSLALWSWRENAGNRRRCPSSPVPADLPSGPALPAPARPAWPGFCPGGLRRGGGPPPRAGRPRCPGGSRAPPGPAPAPEVSGELQSPVMTTPSSGAAAAAAAASPQPRFAQLQGWRLSTGPPAPSHRPRAEEADVGKAILTLPTLSARSLHGACSGARDPGGPPDAGKNAGSPAGSPLTGFPRPGRSRSPGPSQARQGPGVGSAVLGVGRSPGISAPQFLRSIEAAEGRLPLTPPPPALVSLTF
ncbi:basic salivary proline-rich protein 3-like [Phocoena phocoena]|uniref:basic salivary proline-rich protein 3-like n=1 Tax=Phocoena phocoena TaxID=9742 RepID=UPI00330728EE